MNERNNLVIPFSILGITILISVIIFSLAFKSARSELQTITVTGSAQKGITSDHAVLRGRIEVRNPRCESGLPRTSKKNPGTFKLSFGKRISRRQRRIYNCKQLPDLRNDFSGISNTECCSICLFAGN